MSSSDDIWLLKRNKALDSGQPRKTVKNEFTELCDRLDAVEALEQGKTAFLNEENEFAVSLFSAAIALERKGQSGALPELYSNRSSALLA